MKRTFFSLLALSALVITSCKKQDKVEASATEVAGIANPLTDYHGLSEQTLQELLVARGVTARYQNIENAYKDGYEDIGVVLPNMGHHFMNKSLVDGTFEITKPELLVYNKLEDGTYVLGAIEYATPLALSPNTPPEGFSGSSDVWVPFGGLFWTLHAWVWKFNPDGVFNPNNPLVIVR
jgi:hypothetical protein